ncbi:MAG: DUF2799 domain-containing protein [Bdellovibrionaceae bacterium]|nr:DUF2799 domain-containing protein [Pseudobdellovibrionaceae bacterium]
MRCFFWSILILSSLLASCTTLSRRECETIDWKQRGFIDGGKGVRAEKFAQEAQTCREHGIQANAEAYQEGFNQGLESFCTYQGGYDYGLAGQTDTHHCSKDKEAEFLRGNLAGYAVYSKKREVEVMNRALEQSLHQCTFDSDCPKPLRCRYSSSFASGSYVSYRRCQ